MTDRGRPLLSPSPTAATGTSDARASAPSGPPERRSLARPPTNAHHTASRAPAATDQAAATNNGSEGRAPPMVMNGATVPCSNAAASGISSPSARRTELPSRDQVVPATYGLGPS